MWDFSGKTFLITGASSGIGKSIAEYLTRELNANVVMIARRKDILDEMCQCLPGENLAIGYDLRDISNISSIFEICEKENVNLDGLVYSAGVAPLYALKDNDVDNMLDTMKINALAFAEICKGFLNSSIINKGASIVAISSVVSVATTNRQSAYAASKSMLNSYVKYMAKEALGKIRVNAILPGIVETEMTQQLRIKSENYDEKMKRNSPLGVITKDKLSKLVAYLLSDDAEFFTGSLLVMDSGFLLK